MLAHSAPVLRCVCARCCSPATQFLRSRPHTWQPSKARSRRRWSCMALPPSGLGEAGAADTQASAEPAPGAVALWLGVISCNAQVQFATKLI